MEHKQISAQQIDLKEVLSNYAAKSTRSRYQELKLMKRITSGKCSISLQRVEEYLLLLGELPFTERSVLFMLISELLNVDTGLRVIRRRVPQKTWRRVVSECAAICRGRMQKEAETVPDSPISTEETAGSMLPCPPSELHLMVSVIINGTLAVIEHYASGLPPHVFETLMEVFEEKILMHEELTGAHFLLLGAFSAHEPYLDAFIRFLWRGALQPLDPRKERMLIYAASFLSILKEIPDSTIAWLRASLPELGARIEKKDRFAAVSLQALMFLSNSWNGRFSTEPLDAVISEAGERVLERVPHGIQSRYASRHPEFTPQKENNPIKVTFPFNRTDLACIPQAIKNCRWYRKN